MWYQENHLHDLYCSWNTTKTAQPKLYLYNCRIFWQGCPLFQSASLVCCTKYCTFIIQYSKTCQPELAIIWPAIPAIGAMVGEEGIVEANMAPSSPPGLAMVWITTVASPIMMYLRASLLITCLVSSKTFRKRCSASRTVIKRQVSIYLSYRSDTSRWLPRGNKKDLRSCDVRYCKGECLLTQMNKISF